MDQQADWIAADWGTSNLRLWVIGAGGTILAELNGPEGMSRLTPDGFEPALLHHAAPYLADGRMTDVIVCGMAGARGGWVEARYRSVPCTPAGHNPTEVPTADPRLRVRILPGLSQASPADVMRGEETQIAGFLAGDPDFDGTLCLPGTHTKWVQISAGEVVSFRTFMTGELFALLSTGSVLQNTVADQGHDTATFEAAINDSMARPEALGANLFGIRAEALLADMSPQAARARLSGLLIGLELAGARPWWLGTRLALIGAPELTTLYAQALATQGLIAEQQTGAATVLAGLAAARKLINEVPE